MTSSTKKKENHTMRTALGGVALLLTIAATAAACSDSDDNAAPPPSSTPAEPTTSSTPQTPEERASVDAEAAVRRYYETYNAVAANPRLLGQLKSVVVGTLLSADQNTFRDWKSNGYRQIGDVKVTKVEVGLIKLEGRPATVEIDVCWDSAAVKVVDKSGKVMNSGKRTTTATTQYTLANYVKGRPAGKWLAATAVDQAVGSCVL